MVTGCQDFALQLVKEEEKGAWKEDVLLGIHYMFVTGYLQFLGAECEDAGGLLPPVQSWGSL